MAYQANPPPVNTSTPYDSESCPSCSISGPASFLRPRKAAQDGPWHKVENWNKRLAPDFTLI